MSDFRYSTAEAGPHSLLSIEITYRTSDRFGDDRFAEPNVALVQRVFAAIEGVTDIQSESRVPLGSLTLARIDLWEVGDQYFDVLDAESSEWTAYVHVVDAAEDDPRFLLIVDRAELVKWARGNEIGLHAAARAIRTWGDDALVVLTAFPPGVSGPDGKAGGEALSRHWSRLGLDRVEASDPPMLAGSTNSAQVAAALVEFSNWQPPEPPASSNFHGSPVP